MSRNTPHFASLDIGSNTVRLLVAEKDLRRGFRPVRRERKITRLGGGFSFNGYLHPDSQARTLEGVLEMSRLCEKEGVERVFAAATGVLREAKNGKEFLARIARETGISPRLLSGNEEGRLMLRGVLWGAPPGLPVSMAMDIGGWSTELLWIEAGKIRKAGSVSLGAVSLCESFLKSDPPAAGEIQTLDRFLKESAEELRREFEALGWERGRTFRLVGTAGTLTSLAAVDLELTAYDPDKVTGRVIARGRLEEIFSFLAGLPQEKRKKVPGVEEGREDLILSGTRIALILMETLGFDSLVVVDAGLLEGILLAGLDEN